MTQANLPPAPDLWLPAGPGTREQAEVCLLCVPHAGAMHSAFSSWSTHFAQHIEVRSIAMPGRGLRFREPAAADMSSLVACVVDALEALPWRRIALFGDCSGANIALALSKALLHSRTQVLHLFAAGIPDPITPNAAPRHLLSATEFQAWALEEQLLTPDVLASPAHVDYFLRQVRSDYQLVENHRETPNPIECPVTTLVGSSDRLSNHSFEAWARLTTGGWRHEVLAGSHLLGLDAHNELKALIARELLPTVANQSGASAPCNTRASVAAIWREVFATESISGNTHFFSLGGDSRSAVQLTRKLTECFHIELDVTAIFQFPTVDELACHIEDRCRVDAQSTPVPSHPGTREILI